ncbi:hypothetical protein ACWDA7_45835 [Streptomyces sp. NPDC001156]
MWLDPSTFENLDYVFHTLFDDFCDADEPERYLGTSLRTEEEGELMRELGRRAQHRGGRGAQRHRRGVPSGDRLARGRGRRRTPRTGHGRERPAGTRRAARSPDRSISRPLTSVESHSIE